MANNRDEARKKKRDTSCKTSLPSVFSWIAPKERKVNPCDPVKETLPRKTYVPEEGQPAAPATIQPIEPIQVSSREVVLFCGADLPPYGDPVTVPAGTYTSYVSFYNLNLVLNQELSIITNLTADIRGFIENLTISAAELSAALFIYEDQAQQLLDQVATAQDVLDTRAYQDAEQQLECSFGNDYLQLDCPVGTSGSSVIVPANSYFSTDSQEAANQLALEKESLNLNCLICNDEQTLDCEYPIGADTSQFTVTGSATVYAGEVCLATQEEVDAQVDALLTQRLDCLFCNTNGFNLSCPVGSFGDSIEVEAQSECFSTYEELETFLDDLFSLSVTCTYYNVEKNCMCGGGASSTLSPTYSVVIAAGTIPGDTQAEADAEAVRSCNDTLSCAWGNVLKTNSNCGGTEVLLAPGVVPANTYISYTSQAEADQIASDMAAGMVQCFDPENDGGGGGGGGGCGRVESLNSNGEADNTGSNPGDNGSDNGSTATGIHYPISMIGADADGGADDNGSCKKLTLLAADSPASLGLFSTTNNGGSFYYDLIHDAGNAGVARPEFADLSFFEFYVVYKGELKKSRMYCEGPVEP